MNRLEWFARWIAIAVSGLCAARREDRELAAAKAKLAEAAVEVEASLRLVEHDLEETKRSLRGIR